MHSLKQIIYTNIHTHTHTVTKLIISTIKNGSESKDY